MSILIISDNKDISPWIDTLKENNSSLGIRVYPNCKNKDDIIMALVWSSNRVDFKEFKNLKCISSMGSRG